ncbi:MAG: hypothetical protein KIS92_15430 [Planctomycetota bacterium]|nr:hypothetical protein [Planctomycetota bacterium]
MDPGEYDVCTYCGKSIFPDVAECPYCHKYTDGKGPHGLNAGEPRRLAWYYVLAGWVLLLLMLLPFVLQLWAWLK